MGALLPALPPIQQAPVQPHHLASASELAYKATVLRREDAVPVAYFANVKQYERRISDELTGLANVPAGQQPLMQLILQVQGQIANIQQQTNNMQQQMNRMEQQMHRVQHPYFLSNLHLGTTLTWYTVSQQMTQINHFRRSFLKIENNFVR